MTADKAILVMLSGGLDSTYVLYKYLKESDLPVYVHHISMRVSEENRWRAEDSCTAQVIRYCQKIRPFSYSNTTYDFSLPYTGWDADVQVLVAARVAANLDAKSVVVVLGINADDLQREDVADRASRNVLTNLWAAMHASIDPNRRDRVHPTLHLPFKDVRKADMIRELPPELVALTWSCRKPIYRKREDGSAGSSETAAPCGECHACIARNKARDEADAR